MGPQLDPKPGENIERSFAVGLLGEVLLVNTPTVLIKLATPQPQPWAYSVITKAPHLALRTQPISKSTWALIQYVDTCTAGLNLNIRFVFRGSSERINWATGTDPAHHRTNNWGGSWVVVRVIELAIWGSSVVCFEFWCGQIDSRAAPRSAVCGRVPI